MHRHSAWHIGLAALALTGLNAIKPAVVDDTAYLFFARHLAQHPADPYGFEIFWNARPEPAMEVLMPPVLPYWIGLGMAIFGENLLLLKLWLYPFAWILCRGSASLLRRFAPDSGPESIWMLALAPFALGLFNFMLDVPALALGTAALAFMIDGCDAKRWPSVVLAGVCAGLAMQTKYSALVVPGVLGWYAFSQRKIAPGIVAVAVAIAGFAAWEWWLTGQYGRSHFWFHVQDQRVEGQSVGETISTKIALVQPLLGQFGGLMIGFALAVAAPKRPRATLLITAICCTAAIPILLLPNRDWPIAGGTFQIFGLLAVGIIAWRSVEEFPRLLSNRCLFLFGWVALEIAATFALTPFPAARRIMGASFALAILGIAAAGVNGVSLRYCSGLAIVYSLLFFAIDCWDAQVEPRMAERAAEYTRPESGETVWFNGHWGFQYYCDRAGMKAVIPGDTKLKAGDWLITPVIPDDGGFYRPWHGGAKFKIDPERVKPVAILTWDDVLLAQTIPNLYGGGVPIQNRDHPRLTLAIYRVTRDWWPMRDRD